MTKILYFIDRMLLGGIQNLVLSWVSRFDKEKIHVDFLLLDDGKEYKLENSLKELGCNVYKLTGIWVKNPIDFIKESKALDCFFKEHHNYKIIHLHSTSKNYLVLKYAKKYGIPVRIAHSHNIDFQTKNPIKKIVGNIFKINLKKYATDYFACSKKAGKWLFGEKIINSDKFKVIHNAIDYDKFKFDENKRKEIREELNIKDDEIVVGHVGRFSNQKNHEFLIDIFAELYKKNDKFKLLLIGTGETEKLIKEKVKKLNIESRVIFLGFKEDVSKYYNAMDLFLFPSKFEGLGITLIEAQANGLICFTSKDVVPEEAKLSDNLHFIKLNKSDEMWAEEILKYNLSRISCKNEFIENKYLICDIVYELENKYISLTKNNGELNGKY